MTKYEACLRARLLFSYLGEPYAMVRRKDKLRRCVVGYYKRGESKITPLGTGHSFEDAFQNAAKNIP
jgi:hypothetical protein